jgi:hypothetical protein
MANYLRQVLLYGLSIVLTFLSPTVSVANDTAHALWGVGVQIGFAELGANQGMDPGFVASALSYAHILAIQSGCIPTNEIDSLLAAVRNTRDSRSVYPGITAYRQRLATHIVNNCSCGGGAFAPDDKRTFCDQYSRSGISQNEENLRRRCGYTGDRWHSDYNRHFSWCMGRDKEVSSSETRVRDEELKKCGQQGDKRPFCQSYAQTAVSQNEENLRKKCGYAGGRWNSNYDAHFDWCMGIDKGAADSETNIRYEELKKCGGGQNPACDVSGLWYNRIRDIGESQWRFTPTGDGRYSVQEEGLGTAKGTAVLAGNRLRLDWRSEFHGDAGYYEWTLNAPECKVGDGNLVYTSGKSGTYSSRIERVSGTARGVDYAKGRRLAYAAIPANRSTPTDVGIVLERGKSYFLVSEGVVGLWSDRNYGVDSVYRYDVPSGWGGKSLEIWGQLELFNPNIRLPDAIEKYTGRKPAYNPSHVYETVIVGVGQPLRARVLDTGDYGDNSGELRVTIYEAVAR